MARRDGWMAEHMLILRLTNEKTGKQYHVTAAFPERLRQDQPRHAPAHHPGLQGRDRR